MDELTSQIVDIDRLVLDGFDLAPWQAERVRGLIAAELQRLLSEAPGPASASYAEHVAAPIQWQPADGEQALASGIARRLAQALTDTEQQGG